MNLYIVAILVAFVWLVVLTIYMVLGKSKSKRATRAKENVGSCSATSCGAIDPVNDPDYNMREVIKNTVLIEQHLSELNKYCKQCLVKHFLISIGLLEEAIWMAGSERKTYPMLEDSLPLYSGLFDEWYARVDDANVRIVVLDKLRKWRREASELYFPT